MRGDWGRFAAGFAVATLIVALCGCNEGAHDDSPEPDTGPAVGVEDAVATDCTVLYQDWVDERTPRKPRGTTVAPQPLSDHNAGAFPFAAVALAGIDVECATAYVSTGDERTYGVLVWAPGVKESQFDKAAHLAVALGYVLTGDTAPIDTAGGDEGADSAAADGEEAAAWSRRLEVPGDGANGQRAGAGRIGPPGTALKLEYFVPELGDTLGGLAITFTPTLD
jgi:hypothetical protein